MTKEITIKNHYDIGQPVQMVSMANVLKNHIVKQQLYTNIMGKNYAHVEGWQFAGGLMGLFPRVANIENLSNGQELKWKAEVEIVDLKSKEVVARGFALCSNKEGKKKNFDEYAVLSMAQTRAIGKAYRNLIGYVMKLAGYEATPSEEMAKMGEQPKAPEPPKQPTKSSADLKDLQKEASKKVSQNLFANLKGAPECHECGAVVTKAEVEFSKKVFKKQLCRTCQKARKGSK